MRVASAVWKYTLTKPTQIIEMPAGAEVLTVATQRALPTLWALVDPAQPMVPRKFFAVGTGHEFERDSSDEYVGTAHDVEGMGLVFHVFERRD